MVNVSIIIPVYNVEQYIESCLYSVINQTYKGTLECIIVNDCTPDQSMEVVNRLLSVYQGNILFKIINQLYHIAPNIPSKRHQDSNYSFSNNLIK